MGVPTALGSREDIKESVRSLPREGNNGAESMLVMTPGRENSMHLITVLGGVSQIMFTQGGKLFFSKKNLSRFQCGPI